MLKLNHLSISFNHKNIFNNTHFMASDGELTVIIGESGKGKSTLLKTLLFEHKCSYYYYNNDDLTNLNSDEKGQFIFNKISYINQIPQFINDFTIKQHIDFIRNIYSIKEKNADENFKILGIENLLEKYPKQLSGGQKTRVAIYLGLIKKPEIFILDEPTASLDKDNVSHVITLLKKYSQSGHTVIVATHDQHFIEYCDVLYNIQNNKLELASQNRQLNTKLSNETCVYFSKKGYYKYWGTIDSRHRYYNIIMTILISLSILVTVFGTDFSNEANSSFKQQLNSLSSLEMLVYKERAKNEYYSFIGHEYPFTESELNKIKEINHVEKVNWNYSTQLGLATSFSFHSSHGINKNDLMNFSLYDEQNNIINVKNLDDILIDFRSFSSTLDTNKFIHYFSNNGIIISNDLYKKIFDDKKVESPYLEFVCLIPNYDATNFTLYYPEGTEELDSAIPCNSIIGEYKKMKLPISGVVKDDAFINGSIIPEYSIYISNEQLETYIKESYPKEVRVLYEVSLDKDTYSIFYNHIPKNIHYESITFTSTESPWQPNSYIIKVDDISHFNEVAKNILDLGYGIESNYIDSTSFHSLSNQNLNILKISSISVFILLYAFYIYFKYLTMFTNQELSRFLKGLGLTNKQIKRLNNQRYKYNVFKLFILTSILFVTVVEFAVYKQILLFIIKPELKIFVYIFIISIFIEFFLPKLLEKINIHIQNKGINT